jgi:hypothetical protein
MKFIKLIFLIINCGWNGMLLAFLFSSVEDSITLFGGWSRKGI